MISTHNSQLRPQTASARLAHTVTVPVECSACSSRDVQGVEEWPVGKRARAFACRECGLLFVHPPAAKQLPSEPNPNAANRPSATKRSAARALVAALDRYFPASGPPAGARVLQVGSGTGAWLSAFAKYGWETCAIDTSVEAVAPHERLDAIPTATFDFVILYHALERLPRPLDALREVSRTLRPSGYCLISVPRLDMLAVHGEIRYCLRPGKHIVAFTEACLRGLTARAGLQTVASLHELDHAFTPGQPLRLRLLVRRVESPTTETEAYAALKPVLEAASALVRSPELAHGAAVSIVQPSECPACASHQLRIIEEWKLSGNRAQAVSCSDCGLLFAYPQPPPEELQAYYGPGGGWQALRPEQSSSGTQAWANTPVPVILDALDQYVSVNQPAVNARVLDFGCGPGNWLNALQDRGWDTYGVEPSSDAAFARHKRLLTIPTEPQFDLVVAFHVLEHLPRPLETLRELRRAIVPGGHCFISVPRIDTLAVHRQVDYCLHPRHHIVAFTEACLRGLLARSGLQVVASFHMLDDRVSKGLPLRLRLLARRTATPPLPDADAASALKPVIQAFVRMTSKSAPEGPRIAQ
jgi:SAM-dependent methyltransferase